MSASFMVAAEDPQADIFESMQAGDRGTLRASMIDLILGADNAPAQTHHAPVTTWIKLLLKSYGAWHGTHECNWSLSIVRDNGQGDVPARGSVMHTDADKLHTEMRRVKMQPHLVHSTDLQASCFIAELRHQSQSMLSEHRLCC